MKSKSSNSAWSFLLKFLVIIGVVVLLAGLGIFLLIQSVLGLDIFKTFDMLNKLKEGVSIDTIVTHPYSAGNFDSLINKLNSCGLGYLYHENEDGNIIIEPGDQAGVIMLEDFKLTDKEIASLMNNLTANEIKNLIDLGEFGGEVKIEILQVKFSNLTAVNNKKQIAMSVVISMDMTLIKESLINSQESFINGYIPEKLYFISDTQIQKTSDFGCLITSSSFLINKLNASETSLLMDLLELKGNEGNSTEFNKQIAQTIISGIIGSEQSPDGLAYSLQGAGAAGFDFEESDEQIYFIIKKAS